MTRQEFINDLALLNDLEFNDLVLIYRSGGKQVVSLGAGGGAGWAGVAEAGMGALSSIIKTATSKLEKKLTTPINNKNPWTGQTTGVAVGAQPLEDPMTQPIANSQPVNLQSEPLQIDWDSARKNPMERPPQEEESEWDLIEGPDKLVYWLHRDTLQCRLRTRNSVQDLANQLLVSLNQSNVAMLSPSTLLNLVKANLELQKTVQSELASNIAEVNVPDEILPNFNGMPLVQKPSNVGMAPPTPVKKEGGTLEQRLRNILTLEDYLKLTMKNYSDYTLL